MFRTFFTVRYVVRYYYTVHTESLTIPSSKYVRTAFPDSCRASTDRLGRCEFTLRRKTQFAPALLVLSMLCGDAGKLSGDGHLLGGAQLSRLGDPCCHER
jgi:hypothetical protein